MSTMTRGDMLARTESDWAGARRQGYWEIPVALRNATLLRKDKGRWVSSEYLTDELYDWVLTNAQSLTESIFLVGDHADEYAAALVLDLVRQEGVYARYGFEEYLAWTDPNQVTAHRRDNRDDREVRRWLESARVLVTEVRDPADRMYYTSQRALIDSRSKRAHRNITVLYATPSNYSMWDGIDLGLGIAPIFVN